MPDPKFLKPWHGIPREQIEWHPSVDAGVCIGCGTCVTGCSRIVYRFDFEAKKAVVLDPLNCMVGCTTCANTCPTHAISFPSIETIMELESLPIVHHAIEDDLLARRDALELHQSRPSPDRIIGLVVAGMKRFGTSNMVVELEPRTEQDALCQFIPGQYMELWLPGSDFLSRAYSIGSAPRDDGAIELDLRRVEGGRFSEYAFERMQVGDVLQGRGPLGMFRVTSGLDTPLLFAARGTGFALIKAMIEQQLVLTPDRNMLLFWGATDATDFYALEELEAWSRTDPNFRVVLAARAIPDGFAAPGGLAVEPGTVYDAIARTSLSLTGRDSHVAGPRRTTTRVVAVLRGQGLDQGRIMVDAYGD